MFKIFDVANRANNGMFVAAPDEDRAKAVAIKFKHSKKEKNLRAVDITNKMSGDTAWASLREILESEREGWIYKEVPAYTFGEVMTGVDKGGGRWHIQEAKK